MTSLLKAFDPLALHVTETLLGRQGNGAALSFGESLDGTRDVLLVAVRELTDLLAIIPAARALRKRFRLARVHVLTCGECAEVLRARPEIFDVIPWNPQEHAILSKPFFETLREIRNHPFDLTIAVDSGDQRLSRVVGALSGARLRVGIHPEGSDPTLNLVVAAPLVEGYRPVQSLEFLSFLGIPREELAPTWEIPEMDRRYAERLLKLRQKREAPWLVGVDPGRGKCGVRPSPQKLAWLVDRIADAYGAVPLILTSDEEDEGVREFLAHLKATPLKMASRGLRDVLSFTKCCGLFVSGNTDLFHFAVALGVPTLGLFAQSEETRWIPTDEPRCRLLRWKVGDKIHEQDFLAIVDDVRRTDFGDVTVPEAVPEEPAPRRAKVHEKASPGVPRA